MTTKAQKVQILILDDEKMWQTTTRLMCGEILNSLFADKSETEKVSTKFFIASTVEEAQEILLDHKIHLFLLDKDLGIDEKSMKKINGIDFIPTFKSLQPLCQILMLTADLSTIEIARAITYGASDYLFKSNDDAQKGHRLQVIRRALEHHSDQVKKTKGEAPIKRGLYSNYICKSVAMQRLDRKLIAFAESERPVLLLGATGLGKGAVARRISELTRIEKGQGRREFVQINIAATEKNLVDSILFGTEPGAFTDAAKHTKPGLLDAAREGDIFIDEIGDASLELQVKLLKVVEEREFSRVGGTKPLKTDARFIFATNKDLQALIKEGQFREDLYMRICIFEETLPPLSERKEDIPFIVTGFLEAACSKTKNKKIQIEDFPEDLMNYFMRDEIPGNIRGIENDVERLVAHIPCDEYGKPLMQNWKRALGHSGLAPRRSQVLNVEQLMTAKTNFLDKNFPGLWALTQIVEKRIFEEVEAKGLSLEQASEVLNVSVNTVLSRKKQFLGKTKEKTL